MSNNETSLPTESAEPPAERKVTAPLLSLNVHLRIVYDRPWPLQ